jgi:hypothetical protein
MKDPDEVRTMFVVFFMVFEPLRLTAGYHGNLSEKVRMPSLVDASFTPACSLFSWSLLTWYQAWPASSWGSVIEHECLGHTWHESLAGIVIHRAAAYASSFWFCLPPRVSADSALALDFRGHCAASPWCTN